MTEPHTPGAIAYAAFWATTPPDFRGLAWADLDPSTQARWEAAAQAVRQQAIAETLEAQRLLADAARKVPPHA